MKEENAVNPNNNETVQLELTPQMKQIFEKTHESFKRWEASVASDRFWLITNRFIQLQCAGTNPDLSTYAKELKQKYGWDYNTNKIESVLYSSRQSIPVLFSPLLPWCENVANLLLCSLDKV